MYFQRDFFCRYDHLTEVVTSSHFIATHTSQLRNCRFLEHICVAIVVPCWLFGIICIYSIRSSQKRSMAAQCHCYWALRTGKPTLQVVQFALKARAGPPLQVPKNQVTVHRHYKYQSCNPRLSPKAPFINRHINMGCDLQIANGKLSLNPETPCKQLHTPPGLKLFHQFGLQISLALCVAFISLLHVQLPIVVLRNGPVFSKASIQSMLHCSSFILWYIALSDCPITSDPKRAHQP